MADRKICVRLSTCAIAREIFEIAGKPFRYFFLRYDLRSSTSRLGFSGISLKTPPTGSEFYALLHPYNKDIKK